MLTQYVSFSLHFSLQPVQCCCPLHALDHNAYFIPLERLIGASEEMHRTGVWEETRSVHENHLSRLSVSVYSSCICILIVYRWWRRENVKALRDLGERIWLHLCPIKQLAGSRGMPNIFLYLVSSLHLSAYGFMTSKLFGKKKAPLDRASD